MIIIIIIRQLIRRLNMSTKSLQGRRDLEIWVRGHSRSLKLVPFESLGAVSYSPSIVTVAISVAVCEIFSVKEWRDLENQVRGRSRSSKVAPFDRPHATFYRSAIVNINGTI